MNTEDGILSSVESGVNSDPLDPNQQDKSDQHPLRTKDFTITIDLNEIKVSEDSLVDGNLTGAQLRELVYPRIDKSWDLYEMMLGGTDRKIEDSDIVKISDWQRFFSAPTQINPGNLIVQ